MSICSTASSSVTPVPRDGLLERIEVHHHHVDRLDAVLRQLRACAARIVGDGEEPAMDLRMERLDPAVEDFRETGDLRDGARIDAMVAECRSVPPVEMISTFMARRAAANSKSPRLSDTLIRAR